MAADYTVNMSNHRQNDNIKINMMPSEDSSIINLKNQFDDNRFADKLNDEETIQSCNGYGDTNKFVNLDAKQES